MISIVVCSRNEALRNNLVKNIEDTIGCPYEIIVIDNTNNKYSIFSAYNLGLAKATKPIICFMHEDILIHTRMWGEIVKDHFENPSVGIIGIAGGHFLPNGPSSWPSPQLNSINILQSFCENGKKKIVHVKEFSHFKGNTAEVVAIDGVWFCIRKDLYPKIKFDENAFNGFHCYDIDICLQTRESGYKVFVVSNILIEHYSTGDWDSPWIENTIRLYEKWKNSLPQIAGIIISNTEIELREVYTSRNFELLKEISNLQGQLYLIRHSKAYVYGKVFFKPLFKIVKLFQ